MKSRYAFRATITDDEYVHEQSIESISELKVSPLFLLGVLNSGVVSYYAIQKFDFLQRSTFPQMRLGQIKQFPIPNATEQQQEEIAQLVQSIMSEMSKDDREDSKVEKLNVAIDESVMDLFNLTEEEKQTVRDFEV